MGLALILLSGWIARHDRYDVVSIASRDSRFSYWWRRGWLILVGLLFVVAGVAAAVSGSG